MNSVPYLCCAQPIMLPASGVLFGLSCVGYQSDSVTVSLQLTPYQGQAHQTSVAALQAFHDLLLMAVWGLTVLLQD